MGSGHAIWRVRMTERPRPQQRLSVASNACPIRRLLAAPRLGHVGAAYAGVVHAPGRAQPARIPRACAATARSSTRSSSPNWPPRSPSSRSVATASMPPSCTPTSSCPVHAVGFGIDVAPGTGPVATEPLRTSADLRRLRPLQPDDIAYVAETVGPGGRRARRRRRRCWHSPVLRSPSPATSSRAVRAAPTSTPRRCCTPIQACGTS